MIQSNANILVYADVDMNLTDGSSIWLNSLVQVLARDPSNSVHVLLKSRIKKDLLLQDLFRCENVKLTDPFKQFPDFRYENKNRLVPDDALSLIRKLCAEQEYRCLIFRGFEICKKAFVTLENPGKIIPYFSDFTDNPELISKEDKHMLQQMYSNARLIFLQTEEMKAAFLSIVEAKEDKIALLPPMVPDFPLEEPTFRNRNNILVYVGKFSNDYYMYETLMALKKAGGLGYKFNIAGDKFHLDLKVPKKELVALMESLPGVSWKKALNREDVSSFIERSDLGLCWRSEAIDNDRSMELSTKLLEYGRLGKPVLVRRIPIHERLLGADYPFYVDTEEDLIQKIRLAFGDPVLYEKAARRVYAVSLTHTFSNISQHLKPYLEIFATETVALPPEEKFPNLLQFMKGIPKKLFR